jgi:hypothetical protein
MQFSTLLLFFGLLTGINSDLCAQQPARVPSDSRTDTIALYHYHKEMYYREQLLHYLRQTINPHQHAFRLRDSLQKHVPLKPLLPTPQPPAPFESHRYKVRE